MFYMRYFFEHAVQPAQGERLIIHGNDTKCAGNGRPDRTWRIFSLTLCEEVFRPVASVGIGNG